MVVSLVNARVISLFSGDTAEEAKVDLQESYEELKQILSEEGKTMPQLQFVYIFAMD